MAWLPAAPGAYTVASSVGLRPEPWPRLKRRGAEQAAGRARAARRSAQGRGGSWAEDGGTVVVEPATDGAAKLNIPRSLGDTPEEVWENAADAAVHALADGGVNASTVLLPSGAGEVEVGLRTVLKYLRRGGLPFRALVVVPQPMYSYAEEIYRERVGDEAEVIGVEKGADAVKRLALALGKKDRPLVILSNYEELQRVIMAQAQLLHPRSRRPLLELLVLEAAHLMRAGGYREAGSDSSVVKARKRLFISARRLAGLPPGALLAPGQEPSYPKEAPASRFGPEVYRLTHEDTDQRNMTVPVRLAFLESVNASDVANELVGLHERLGIRTFQIVPPQRRLTATLNEMLGNLTAGACGISTGADAGHGHVDALIMAGSNPEYVVVAQEFCRLARWAPGKRYGYVFLATAAKHHAVKAWQALAIEDEAAEEAIQRATVEAGHTDRRLRWPEVPRELADLIAEGSPRKEAEIAVARGVEGLGDPWDAWLGRLAAFRDRWGHVKVSWMSGIFGHRLGHWVFEQRDAWKRGMLHSRKVARLKGMGFMLDLESEVFAQGLSELRKYVMFKRRRIVPLSYTTESKFPLGQWVVEQRTKQRRGKLTLRQIELLREAFFLWQPAEMPSLFFSHPEDPEAAAITRALEEEMRRLRLQPMGERRRHFRSLVLKHHPDISESEHAGSTITFLAEVKDWFLAGN